MSLLHKAITLSGACAIGLTLAFAAPAAAEDAKPINFRAVGGAVGRDIPCITDSTVMLVRKNMPDADVYKITKAIVEGFEELHAVQPTWKTLVPEHMADNLALPLHPGAEKYYREAGIIK